MDKVGNIVTSLLVADIRNSHLQYRLPATRGPLIRHITTETYTTSNGFSSSTAIRCSMAEIFSIQDFGTQISWTSNISGFGARSDGILGWPMCTEMLETVAKV